MPKEEGITDWKFIFRINKALGILKYIDKLDENKAKMKFVLNRLATNVESKDSLIKIENSIQKIEDIKMRSENGIKNVKEEAINNIQKIQDKVNVYIGSIFNKIRSRLRYAEYYNRIRNDFFIKLDMVKGKINSQKYESKILVKIDILKRNVGIYKRGINIVEEVLK
ncbi:MAG: hypothetical protein QW695_05220 [Candidatus Bathyarchaeia archaeon]